MLVEMIPHPEPEILAAFGRGDLPPDDRAAVEHHVATCDTCCAFLAALSEDRLAALAREAAANSDGTSDTCQLPQIPRELIDHPRYRILGPLGAGGMGVVYKAEHKLMGRIVALKVIARRYTSSPAAIERFLREFKATGQLHHKNIVTAHDADKWNGLHFLVMEFVEGMSLDRLVARRGPLPIATACQCVRQAAQGLQHAFEQGMVHRDIKPHNLMVTRKGRVKVLDFGLARLAAVTESDAPTAGDDGGRNEFTRVTTPSLVIGTPDYLAPEQARNAHAVDIRADIYALGCVLYFLLTGRPPFARRTSAMDKLFAHVENEPDPVRTTRPEVPVELEAILKRMMAKKPADRFATPSEVAISMKPFTRMEAVIDDRPEVIEPRPLPAAPGVSTAAIRAAETMAATARPAPRRGTIPRPRRKRAIPWIIAGAFVAMAAGLIGLILAVNGNTADGGTDRAAKGGGPSEPAGVVAGKRVLFVVPHEGLNVPDYEPVVGCLTAAGIHVDTASVATSECRGFRGRPTGVTPRYLVSDVKPADYDGVLFCGATHVEYTNRSGPGYQPVQRIILEMQSSRKVIGAICVGQFVLREFKLIPGKVHGVVTQDRLVTAELDTDAPKFADAVLAALAKGE